MWDENEGRDFCVNLHLGMQDYTYVCVYQLFIKVTLVMKNIKVKEFWLLISFGFRAYREYSPYLNLVTANWVIIWKTFFKLLQFHFCFKLHNVKKCHRHLAIILEDHHQSHTIILPDWTLKKRALSNFAFQHCKEFIGTQCKKNFSDPPRDSWGLH